MLHISCALITGNSSTLKTSSISTNSWGPELFKTLQETSYIPLGDISRAFECTTHMTISSTLTFTNTLPEAPVTQNSTSKSRTRSYENLVDVVVSGNFWSILAWPCFVWDMAVVPLLKHCLSTVNHIQYAEKSICQ